MSPTASPRAARALIVLSLLAGSVLGTEPATARAAAPLPATTSWTADPGSDSVFHIDGQPPAGRTPTGERVTTAGGLSAASVTSTGQGFLTRADAIRGPFTIQLAGPGVEAYRAHVQAAATTISSRTGVAIQVQAGTVGMSDSYVPGIVRVQVSATSPCGSLHTGVIGCGGWSAAWEGGKLVVQAGVVWLSDWLPQYGAGTQQATVLHELGHAFGLDHYNATYGGTLQLMYPYVGGTRTTYQAGDLAGFSYLHLPTAAPPPAPPHYATVTGDFDGDGRSDALVYGSGTAAESLWFGERYRLWKTGTVPPVGGSSYQLLVGDFDGDRCDDILWYVPGGAADYIWWGSSRRSFTSTRLTANGTFRPFTGDFNGDGRADIFWYAPGIATDHIWSGTPQRSFTTARVQVNGTYTAFTGDWDRNGTDDIFWYAPGTHPDHLWWRTPADAGSATQLAVNGTYRPFSGDFNGDGAEDIFWYAPGTHPDHLWSGSATRAFRDTSITATGTFSAGPGDFDGDGVDDVLWATPADGLLHDPIWYFTVGSGSLLATTLRVLGG